MGYDHGVSPGEIVGALANELGIEGKYIGHIDIRDRYSVVALPDGMPPELFQHLRRIHVRGQALKARQWQEEGQNQGPNPGPNSSRHEGDERPPRRDPAPQAGEREHGHKPFKKKRK